MVLEDFGKLWIASSDLTYRPAQVRKQFEYGADTVVLKTAVRNPPQNGKNYVVRDGVIIYYDFSQHPALEILIKAVPVFLEDALEGGFLEGFRIKREQGSVAFYSHNGDAKILSVEESNELYREVKRAFPDKRVVQSLGIARREDYGLVDQLEGDAVELCLRYYHKFQHTPLLFPNDPLLAVALGVEKQVDRYHQNRREVYEMAAEYASRRRTRPVLLKMERQKVALDYVAFSDLGFDGYTCCDSGRNFITNRDPRVGFILLNKGKTSGRKTLGSTLSVTQLLRTRHPRTYLSASGGVMRPQDAQIALMAGANSVQLCSAIYLGGTGVIREFAQALN